MRPRLVFASVGLGLALGAASVVEAATPGDPFESFNRRIYGSSSDADRRFLLPLARLYRMLTPGPIGKALHNIFTNLGEPVVIFNDVLQVRLKQAADDTVRFTANSLVGLGGLMDVATSSGLPHHTNDFGVTLGVWGVGPGPYLYLPLVGPTTVRDGIGTGVDIAMNPLTYLRYPYRNAVSYTTQVLGGLDLRERAEGDLNALLSGAADPYATLRSVYLQNREALVRGESAPPQLPQIDEPPDAAPPPASKAPSDQQPPSGASTSPGPQSLNSVSTISSDPDAPIRTARLADIDAYAPARLASNETP